MEIRIIQWNIKINSNTKIISDLLNKVIKHNTIVHLQEVTCKANRVLIDNLNPDDYCFSLNLRKPSPNEGKNRAMGVSTLVFGGSIKEYSLVNRSVFPERTLDSIAQFDGETIRSLNFHSLTGVDYKKAKSSNFATLADHMLDYSFDFFACDANEPKIDSIYTEEIEFFDNRDKGKCAGLVFGVPSVHNLQDALKTKLKKQNIQHLDEPLAVSHKVRGKPRRYDHVFHGEKWLVDNVHYDYETAIQATSDHAIVICDFIRHS